MGSRGWIKLHRRIQDHWIYQEERTFSRYEAWLDLIMLANHKDNRSLIDGELITVEKGSFITSKRKLGTRWKWSNTKVNNFLSLLEQDKMIIQKSDTKKTVVTIVKYEVYHELEKEKHHENDSGEMENEEIESNNEIENTQNSITKKTGESIDDIDFSRNDKNKKHNGNATGTHRKHNGNITETHKQELKNLRTKELKRTTTTTREIISDAIVFYQENFGSITPHVSNDLLVWLDDLGDELVIEAMKRAVERNKKNWGYVKSILQSWLKKNIRTIEQAKAEEVEFQNQQKARFGNNNFNQKTEIKPDWFDKRKQQLQQPQQEPVDEQAQAEMEALLSKYS